MLACASLATSACCLRCQLRQAIFSARCESKQRCAEALKGSALRRFTISRSGHEEQAGEGRSTFLKSTGSDDRKKEIYRRTYPLGRIVGRPGRRQLERSETLRTPAMQKPFDVVVLQDVKIPETFSKADLSSPEEDLKRDEKRTNDNVFSLEAEATEEEVIASIDGLKPANQFVDHNAYKDLRQQLLHGYNRRQLSLYLAKSQPTTKEGAHSDWQGIESRVSDRSSMRHPDWRPGQSPLQTPHNQGIMKRKQDYRRYKIIDDILSKVWNVEVEADEGMIGELEMSLPPWQLRLLFGRDRNGRHIYEEMLQSPLLLRTSEIERSPVANILRITARRRIAEEIAHIIGRALFELKCKDFDLSKIESVLAKRGRRLKAKNIFSDGALLSVEQHTSCVVERKDDKTLVVYAQRDSQLQEAQRLLLSLIELPSPTHVIDVSPSQIRSRQTGAAALGSFLQIPEADTANLPLRYRNKQLSRFAKPIVKSDVTLEDSAGDIVEERDDVYSRRIVEQLISHQPRYNLDSGGAKGASAGGEEHFKKHKSYWTSLGDCIVSPWEAHICRILQPYRKAHRGKRSGKDGKPKEGHDDQWPATVIQSRVPRVNDLLSHFSPKEAERALDASHALPTPPLLVAHFMPSPVSADNKSAMHALPPIKLTYELIQSSPVGTFGLIVMPRIQSMQAMLEKTDLRVPLPEEMADLRFVRRTLLDAKIDEVLQDEEVQRFTSALQQSLENGTDRLVGEPIMKIKLPAVLVPDNTGWRRSTEERGDIELDYVFERFEQVQTADFVVPHDGLQSGNTSRDMRTLLGNMDHAAVLQYRTIDGGVAGGSSTELAILAEPADGAQTKVQQGSRDVAKEEVNERLVKTSLAVVHCLTQINAGHMSPLQTPV